MSRESYAEFEKLINEKTESAEKAEACIAFMRDTLSIQEGGRMKEFWDAKNLCMEAFKGTMPQPKRKVLWEGYVELIEEAKRLKAILDDQASFAIEQIDLAIDAVKKEAESKPIKPLEVISPNHNGAYATYVAEVNLMQTLGQRLIRLREEVIKTEMRIREKNRLLKSISEVGDAVFPAKKEAIKQMGELLLKDIEDYLASERVSMDGVRAFQQFSKEIPVNSFTFRKARDLLSEGWNHAKRQVKRNEAPRKTVQLECLDKEAETAVNAGDMVALKDLQKRLKTRLEDFRKKTGQSGLDFESALIYRELIEKEREALKSVERAIKHL